MAQEIERKFLVIGDDWRTVPGKSYRQGYLNSAKERIVRVRTLSDQGFLTIKGITAGATRLEYEYEIPLADANELLDLLCERPLIEKIRYELDYAGFRWDIDEFGGENEGLIVAEVELQDEDQAFKKPVWLGVEVTGDPRYFNSNLIAHPFKKW